MTRVTPTGAGFLAGLLITVSASAGDWPQWCGSDGRTWCRTRRACPSRSCRARSGAEQRTIDLSTAKNVKWGVKLCDAFYSTPSVAGGKVFLGGLDGQDGIFACLDAATGKRLWQWKAPPRDVPRHDRRLFDRHRRDSAADRRLLVGRGRWGSRLFRLQPLRRGVPGCRAVNRRGPRPARPASCGPTTCGRSWACFPAMRPTVLR